MLNPFFGQELRAAREASGCSLRGFANKLDVTPGYLSRVETGQAPPLTAPLVLKAARLLRADPVKLMLARALSAREATLPLEANDARAELAARLVVEWPTLSVGVAKELLSLLTRRVGAQPEGSNDVREA